MATFDALTPRTRNRYSRSTKAPTLVHLDRVTKLGTDREPAFTDLSLRIRAGQRWVVFCQQWESSSALLQCVAGLQRPDQGEVIIRGHVSWPLGQVAGMSNKLSCAENSRFVVGIYGQRGQRDQELALVRELMDLSNAQWLSPLVQLPGEIRTRLKLALSLACDFDLYVMDPAALQQVRQGPLWNERWQGVLQQRLQTRAVISTGLDDLAGLVEGSNGLVLEQGRVVMKGALADCQAYLEDQKAAKGSNQQPGKA